MNGYVMRSGETMCGAGFAYARPKERPAYLNFPESSDPVAQLRFLPECFLEACKDVLDNGVEHILYLQLLISEEE